MGQTGSRKKKQNEQRHVGCVLGTSARLGCPGGPLANPHGSLAGLASPAGQGHRFWSSQGTWRRKTSEQATAASTLTNPSFLPTPLAARRGVSSATDTQPTQDTLPLETKLGAAQPSAPDGSALAPAILFICSFLLQLRLVPITSKP